MALFGKPAKDPKKNFIERKADQRRKKRLAGSSGYEGVSFGGERRRRKPPRPGSSWGGA